MPHSSQDRHTSFIVSIPRQPVTNLTRSRRLLRLRERTQVYKTLAANGSTRERETGKQRKRQRRIHGDGQRKARRGREGYAEAGHILNRVYNCTESTKFPT